ncbi:MAG: ATP-binding protein [Gammaproteobacteria bacterium]|nr:ATP-binding protein [Gammaproteobacteria bacterium]
MEFKEFKRLIGEPLEAGRSLFLFGPRGTGKTTWLKRRLPDALFINLLRSEFYNPLSAEPGRIRTLIPPLYRNWVIIDEVQRIPELLNEVHDLIESRGLRFILTGSSARALRRKGVNLLAGRARTYFMHPLTAAEQGDAFDLGKSLRFGHLPARFNDPDPHRYLRDYVQTYLREEVMQEGLTRNIGHFARFLETASLSQGQPLNISGIAREAQVSRPAAENYFSILDDLLLAVRLPVFSRRARRKLVSQQKFYLFDAGVFRAIRPVGPLDSDAEIDGPALETLVLQELRAANDYQECGYRLHYWRTRAQMEVDFVLYGPRGVLAIEVKRSRHVHPADTRSLREFKKDYPSARCYVFYGGEQELHLDGITAIPMEQALPGIANILQGG